MIPNLETALTGEINELEKRFLESVPAIERWIRLEWMEHTPPLYSAVQITNAGYKLSVTQTDLQPSCWQNLSEQILILAVRAAQAAIEKICPLARCLMIVTPNLTNGTLTKEEIASLLRLEEIFTLAGLEVAFGSIDAHLKENLELTSENGKKILLQPAISSGTKLVLPNFTPCTILLTNNLSAGIPGILEELQGQYILPPVQAGWSMRRKSHHFKNYTEICKSFGKMLGIDPWIISLIYESYNPANQKNNKDISYLEYIIDLQITKIRRKYKEYGIQQKAFITIEADYKKQGSQKIIINDAKQIYQIKDTIPQGELLILEGLTSIEQINQQAVEPVIYAMDKYVVGGYYKTSQGENPSKIISLHPNEKAKPNMLEPINRFYMYGTLARLSSVAASYELEQTAIKTN